MITDPETTAKAFHTRRLELPDGKGWIEIRGEFNSFDLNESQRDLLSVVADWFNEFDRKYCQRNQPSEPETKAASQQKEDSGERDR